MRKKGPGLKILLGIIICLGGGMLSGLLMGNAWEKWYIFLDKPSFLPRAYVFPIVWPILYIMMGIALGLVWHAKKPEKKTAMSLFFLQLLFNFAWSFLFFFLRSPLLGLIDLSLLWVSLILTIGAFWGLSRLSGILLIPYFAWVSFAWIINFAIWKLN